MHLAPRGEGKKADDDDEGHSDVDEDEATSEAGKVLGRERVEDTVHDEKSGEETILHARRDIEIAVFGGEDCGPNHLSKTPLGRGDTRDLAEEVKPSNKPAGDGAVLAGDEPGTSGVETTTGRIGGDLETTSGKRKGGGGKSAGYQGPGEKEIWDRTVWH